MKRKYNKKDYKFKPFVDGYFNIEKTEGFNYLLGYQIIEHNLSSVIMPDVKPIRRIVHLPAE